LIKNLYLNQTKMFSKTSQYAIRAVLYLAVSSSPENKIGVKEIAEALAVPKHFLAKILQQLSRHNLISSTKGPSGGFFLSAENRKANLRTVIESIDGPDVFNSCILGLPVCSSKNPCPLHAEALTYREGLFNLVGLKTIDEVAFRVMDGEVKI
jgi:Rrf2 family transcriptional regulator, iron-sulfur cluster assembly transcription factor